MSGCGDGGRWPSGGERWKSSVVKKAEAEVDECEGDELRVKGGGVKGGGVLW